MATHTVIEGNAFYEIDEDCMRRKVQRKEHDEASRNETGGREGGDIGKERKNINEDGRKNRIDRKTCRGDAS